MKLIFLLAVSFIHSTAFWTLHSIYNSTNFFDYFHFFNKNQSVPIKAGNKTVSSDGRKSVRVFAKESYNHGLFIIDLNHIPTGCGTWPAFWLVGNSWSQNGEIDIIEGVNKAKHNTISIHSNNECITSNITNSLSSPSFTCSGTKCASRISDANSFNKNKGGVYVVHWIRATSFQIWFFSRDSIPADITSRNPTQWPAPALYYHYGTCNPAVFSNLTITLYLAFCGSWAGNRASYSGCPERCESFVKNAPSAFSEAYWDINYIKVYQ